MSPDTYLKDANRVFAETLLECMDENGIQPGEKYTYKDVKDTIALCIDKVYEPTWRELLEWVDPDGKKERTRALLRQSIGSMYG